MIKTDKKLLNKLGFLSFGLNNMDCNDKDSLIKYYESGDWEYNYLRNVYGSHRINGAEYYFFIERMINFHIDLNTINYNGCTPIMYVSIRNFDRVLYLLIDHGVNYELPYLGPQLVKSGRHILHQLWYPIHYAAWNSSYDVLKILIARNKDPNIFRVMVPIYSGGNRFTVLMLAMGAGIIHINPFNFDMSIATQWLGKTNADCIQILRWPDGQSYLLDICLALGPLELPPYIILEIFDWLPLREECFFLKSSVSEMYRVSQYLKVRMIEGVMKSRRRRRLVRSTLNLPL